MNGEDPEQAEDTCAENGHQRRLQGMPQATHRRGRNLIERRYPLRSHGQRDTYHGIVDYRRVSGKEFQEEVLTKEHHHVAAERGQGTADKTDAENALATLHLSGTVVLPYEGNTCSAERVHKEVAVSIENLRCRRARHGR